MSLFATHPPIEARIAALNGRRQRLIARDASGPPEPARTVRHSGGTKPSLPK